MFLVFRREVFVGNVEVFPVDEFLEMVPDELLVGFGTHGSFPPYWFLVSSC